MRGGRKHLSDAEIALLRSHWRAGMRPCAAAAALGCSERTISKYYAEFDGRPQLVSSGSMRIRAVSGSRAAAADAPLPVGGSDFIRPLTKAELMRGRA